MVAETPSISFTGVGVDDGVDETVSAVLDSVALPEADELKALVEMELDEAELEEEAPSR